MTPREVIAKAIYEASGYPWDGALYPHVFLKEADAVIDALEGMEVTESMYQAWCNAPVASMDDDSHGRTDCGAEWRAMVGAMRESK